MKHVYCITLFLLSVLLCSCESTQAVITPAEQSSVFNTTFTPVLTTEPTITTPPTTTQTQEPPFITEAPPDLPITTSMPIDAKIPDYYGWGKSSFYLGLERVGDHDHVDSNGNSNGSVYVFEDGASIELTIRVGYSVSASTMKPMYPIDPSELMKINFLVNNAPLADFVSDEQCVVADFWTNMKYMIHPWEMAPYLAAAPVTIMLHTDVLPEGDGSIRYSYKNGDFYSDSGGLHYGRRDGLLILTTIVGENNIDRAYQKYLKSQAE